MQHEDSRPLRIMMLGPFGLHPKGTMRARALPAARALAHRGHSVEIVMPPWHTPQDAGATWLDEGSGVRLTYVSLDDLSAPIVGHYIVARRMVRRVLAAKPDVVHAFKPKAYSGLAAMDIRLRQRLGTQTRLVMDTDDWEGPGGWNELEPYGRLQQRFFAWQERWGLLHADAVTVASRALQSLVWSLGVGREQVTYMPNAVALADVPGSAVQPSARRALNAPAGLAERAADIASGGAILLYTRFFDFQLPRPLDVLELVRRTLPRTRLVVAGKGLFGEEESFLEMAAARGLADAVDYLGWLEHEAAAALFASVDVALYPFDDTLVNRTRSPMKLLDLMAAGLPVVAEDVGEIGQVIEHGRSGLLVTPGDVGALATQVVRLLASPEDRAAMGRQAQEQIRRSYTWEQRAGLLERVYRGEVTETQAGP